MQGRSEWDYCIAHMEELEFRHSDLGHDHDELLLGEEGDLGRREELAAACVRHRAPAIWRVQEDVIERTPNTEVGKPGRRSIRQLLIRGKSLIYLLPIFITDAPKVA